jgi:hypothetical protein
VLRDRGRVERGRSRIAVLDSGTHVHALVAVGEVATAQLAHAFQQTKSIRPNVKGQRGFTAFGVKEAFWSKRPKGKNGAGGGAWPDVNVKRRKTGGPIVANLAGSDFR